MENTEKSCRHEYVKIFQRKYKGLGRRLVSTRGYLPVGFSIKDFAHLSIGSFCFCTGCRARLFPARVDSAKSGKIEALKLNEVELISQSTELSEVSPIEDLQLVNVEELQIESVDVSDISDQKVIVSGEDDLEEEEGKE